MMAQLLPDKKQKKSINDLEKYDPEALWEYLVKNHSDWLYNNNQQLNKFIHISFLD